MQQSIIYLFLGIGRYNNGLPLFVNNNICCYIVTCGILTICRKTIIINIIVIIIFSHVCFIFHYLLKIIRVIMQMFENILKISIKSKKGGLFWST